MDYSAVADDYFINLNVQTTLALPGSRETVLHFVEAVQKQFPAMTSFYQRETGEFVLEGDRDSGSYPWLEMTGHQLSSGYFNPPDADAAFRLHRWLLDRSVYFLGVSGLDVECLDVLFGFNLDYLGNRDAIVAQATLGGSPLGMLLAHENTAKALEFEPSFVVALDEDCYLQARLHMETHSSTYQVRTNEYEDEPISVYLTVRRYPRPGSVLDMKQSFAEQCQLAERLVESMLIPNIVQPIASAIAANQ